MIKPIKACKPDDALPVASHRRVAHEALKNAKHAGLRAAGDKMSRVDANSIVAQGLHSHRRRAMLSLAGYYTELRRLDY